MTDTITKKRSLLTEDTRVDALKIHHIDQIKVFCVSASYPYQHGSFIKDYLQRLTDKPFVHYELQFVRGGSPSVISIDVGLNSQILVSMPRWWS